MQCYRVRQNKLRVAKKVKALTYLGSKCSICGYDRCEWALEFHHTDPTQKDADFGKMKDWSWDKVRTELDKCVLLCSNCHRETHAGLHQ